MVATHKIILIVVAGLLLACGAPLYAAEPLVNGLWEQTDDSGRVGGWFLFFERDGLFNGALVRAFPKPGEPQMPTCSNCKDDQKGAPMMGLIIVKDMQRRGLSYENGTILDPRDGSIYRAKLELSPDGQRLTVRGFLGIELFGQSQVWRRLPDNALPRSEIPENVRPYVTASAPAPKPSGGAAARPSGTSQPQRSGVTGSSRAGAAQSR